MPTPRRTKPQILDAATCAVFDHWLRTGDGCTAAEVAKAIDVPASTLRKYVDGASPLGCTTRDVVRAVSSKNYVGMIIAHRTIPGWWPSESYTRARIRALMAEGGE